ncbi:MAG: MarR family winged helix-turn-helix transcriptional regulator [Bilifractor sp.]
MNQLEEEVVRSMHQFGKLKSLFCTPGISRGKMWLMGVTWRLSGNREDHKVRVSDIVAGTGIPAPGVSRILNDLEKDGMVVRTLDPTDRRTTLVSITEKGESKRKKAVLELEEYLGEVIDAMGEDKVRSLCALLNEFSDQSKLVLSRHGKGKEETV